MKNKNCPNCGAPIESEKCGYCGTVFIDFACFDVDEPFYARIRHNGQIVDFKLRTKSATVTMESDPLYADNRIIYCRSRGDLTMEFEVLT